MLQESLEGVDRLMAQFGIEPRHPFSTIGASWEYTVALPAEVIFWVGRRAGSSSGRSTASSHPPSRGATTRPSSAASPSIACIGDTDPFEQFVLTEAEILSPYIDHGALRKLHRSFVQEPTLQKAQALQQVLLLQDWLRQEQAL